MHYDSNYRNQFFRDSANSFGIREAFAVMKREFQVAEYKTKMPKSKPIRILIRITQIINCPYTIK